MDSDSTQDTQRQSATPTCDSGEEKTSEEEFKKQLQEKDETIKKLHKKIAELEKEKLAKKNGGESDQGESGKQDELDFGNFSSQRQDVLEEKEQERTNDKSSSTKKSHENTRKGLAFICTHETYHVTGTRLYPRTGCSSNEAEMMENIWKKYGCVVRTFTDEKQKFYEEELLKKVEEDLEKEQKLDFFVFMLSSHGVMLKESQSHVDQPPEHYFYANDGLCCTKEVIDKICANDKLKEKLKLFFIQACRTNPRSTEDETQDIGHSLPVITKSEDLHTYVQKEDTNGYTQPDAQPGYDSYTQTAKSDHILTKNSLDEVRAEESDDHIELIDIYYGMPRIPSNTILMFGSMTGKYAYSLINSMDSGGGWFVKFLHETINEYQTKEPKTYVLDILTDVNRRIGFAEFGGKPFNCNESDFERNFLEKVEGYVKFLTEIITNEVQLLEEMNKESNNDELETNVNVLNELKAKLKNVELGWIIRRSFAQQKEEKDTLLKKCASTLGRIHKQFQRFELLFPVYTESDTQSMLSCKIEIHILYLKDTVNRSISLLDSKHASKIFGNVEKERTRLVTLNEDLIKLQEEILVMIEKKYTTDGDQRRRILGVCEDSLRVWYTKIHDCDKAFTTYNHTDEQQVIQCKVEHHTESISARIENKKTVLTSAREKGVLHDVTKEIQELSALHISLRNDKDMLTERIREVFEKEINEKQQMVSYCKNELGTYTNKLEEKLKLTVKVQSCFHHNITLDDEDLYLYRVI